MSSKLIQGYSLDEIDSLAKDMIQLICEYDAPIELGIIGLCRAIVMVGTAEDLDSACRLIDELSELPFDGMGEVE